LESVVFGIIGLELPALVRGVTGGGLWPLYALALAATGIVVRFLWVFPVSAMSSRDSGQHPWPVATVVSWAGARGVVPLAAALSIPLSTPAGTPLAGRNLVLLLTIAVTVLTLIVQGFTLAPMVRRSGITLDAQDVAREQIAARLLLARTGLAHLDEMMRFENTPEPVMEQLRRSWEARIHRIQTHESAESSPSSATLAYRQLRRHLIAIESNELNRLYEAGMVTDAIRRRIQHQLDLEHATVSDEDPR
jgi:CPA1 family monovalent cation:H+ antiporter